MEVPRESSLQFYKLDCLFWKAWIMWGTSNHNSGCIMHQSLNCKGAIEGKIDSSSDHEMLKIIIQVLKGNTTELNV